MRHTDIRRHLRVYEIYKKRKTTVNHAFAAAVAPCDKYDEKQVAAAIRLLGQDPDKDLLCVYCDAEAETWDHVFATVKNSEFSGAGHRIGNLVPCCKPCNSRKGNKDWQSYVQGRNESGELIKKRTTQINRYLSKYFSVDRLPSDVPEYAQLLDIRDEIHRLMQAADTLAAKIRLHLKK